MHDYLKPKHGEKGKLCHMATDTITVYIKAEEICMDIAKDSKTKTDSAKQKLERQLHSGTKKFRRGLK